MIKKCTDEELEKVIDPFYDNYHEFVVTYVMSEVIAFYIANSFSRNAMWMQHFINTIILLKILLIFVMIKIMIRLKLK